MTFGFSIMMLLLIPLFFLPTILAIKNNHPYKIPIIIINILGGLLWGVGWLIALVWCFITPDENSSIDATNELEKLHELKEKGIITQEEFDAKKKSLLGL